MAAKLILSNGMNENPAVSKKIIVICDDNAALTALMKHLLQKKVTARPSEVTPS